MLEKPLVGAEPRTAVKDFGGKLSRKLGSRQKDNQ
jgi:hypothetical protein